MMESIVLYLLLSLFLRLFMLYLPVVCPSDTAEQHSIASINNNLSVHELWLELFPEWAINTPKNTLQSSSS